ncbi:MAG: hypothetical protein JNK82_32125 [Myxococcaceae bacterium]|nr:hypothetical protein [Myxococcaceae bacterium]
MRFLGRWLFRIYLMQLLTFVGAITAVLVTLEKLTRRTELPWKTRFFDRLLSPDSTVYPALKQSFADDFEQPTDGPGWSEDQLPRLWGTCRALAAALGCPPPDAIHLSVEPGDCMAWQSRVGDGPVRRHIALSLLDLRLVSHDEARAVIAHELVHAGFDHVRQGYDEAKQATLMRAVWGRLPWPLRLGLLVPMGLYTIGVESAAHAHEREADRKAAAVVGGNHTARALERMMLQAPVLARVFAVVHARAALGERAPQRLAEAAYQLYSRYEFSQLKEHAAAESVVPGEQHPSLPERVAGSEREPSRAGIGGQRSFIEAYPELLAAEELLTRTYFPDKAHHQRSDASQLRRKALAARLKRR